MDFTKISRADMVRIMKLIDRKEELQAQIDAIDRELRGGGSAVVGAAPKVRKPRAAKQSSATPPAEGDAAVPSPKRGAVREAIVGLLQAAGADGISVKEIAEKLCKPPGHIHTWFSITGKGIANVRKLGGGRWAWVVSDAPAA
jgi:hypothetical protein